MYNKEVVKFAQKELSEQTGITLTVDGSAGQNTATALLHVEQIPTDWTIKRQVVGYIQYLCATEGFNAGPIDGYWGPQTEDGYEKLAAKNNGGWKPWRKDEADGIGNLVGGFIGKLFGTEVKNDWPNQTQHSLEKYYGPVGKNMTKVDVPYPLRIAWNKAQIVRRVTCHEKVSESVSRILIRVHEHYGDQIKPLGLDLFGGCLNVRKMRGGSSWSTHSWGMAFDWDPENNRLRWKSNKASFAKSEYDEWWKIWEDEGWVSLGRQRDYDWMHVQAAKVRKK